MAQLLDNRFKRSFTFRCCLRCVRPIHRRRRIGIVLTAIGAVIVLACFTFIVLLELSPAFVELARTYLRPTSGVRLLPLYVLILLFIVGFLSAFVGLWMRAYSPFVRIMDGGGEQIYFHFRSQLYRTQFAQLNGEE